MNRIQLLEDEGVVLLVVRLALKAFVSQDRIAVDQSYSENLRNREGAG